MVRGGEIEVDAAEGAFGFCLAEDDGDLLVEGDAVAEVRAAILIGCHGSLFLPFSHPKKWKQQKTPV